MKAFSELSILSLGDLVSDLNVAIENLPVVHQGHQLVDHVRLEPGGAGNFMLAGARLGCQMIALGVVGDDIYGREMLAVLESDGNTTLVFVLADNHGHHVFLGQVGRGPQVSLQENWKTALRAADAVHSYGYTLREERLAPTLLAGMEYGLSCGKMVFFDPGPHVVNVPYETRLQALRRCSAVLLTEEEIPLVVPGGQGLADAPRLFSETVKLVVVKLGSEGSLALTADGGRAEHPGFKVPLIDSTAAGDSFAAAFIASWLQGRPLVEVLAIANAMGAAKVQKPGSGRQVPTLAEVRAVLNGLVEI
jgi:sugar/nucleoside kinase (ribokinase family)